MAWQTGEVRRAKPGGLLPLFGNRAITCGFAHSDRDAAVSGKALVDRTGRSVLSVGPFAARRFSRGG